MEESEEFEVVTTIWRWRPTGKGGGWHFLTIDRQTAAEMRFAALGRTGGFGSIKVQVRMGQTVWHTSIFPQRENGGFILPIKADVRKRERVNEGDEVTVWLLV